MNLHNLIKLVAIIVLTWPIRVYAQPSAGYVDRILRGEKPADMPVQRSTKVDLVINLKTGKQIGVTIPQTVLYQADTVIK